MFVYPLIYRRKLLISAILVFLGVYTYGIAIKNLFHPVKTLILVTVVAVFVILFIHVLGLRKRLIILFLLGVIVMGLWTNSYYNSIETGNHRGVITAYSETEYGVRYTCRFFLDNKLDKDFYLYSKNPDTNPKIMLGEIIAFSSNLSLPNKHSNPRTFDYRDYCFGIGIIGEGNLHNYKVIGASGNSLVRMKARIILVRESFLERVFSNSEARGLCRGILFGDKSEISEDTYEEFRINGTAHILAVSGLHIGIIYAMFQRLRKKLRNKKESNVFDFLLVAFLLIYGTLALWTPSVTRGILLVLLKILADYKRRKYDMVSALSGINLVMMLLRPYVIYSSGFQMSFLAAFTIAIVAPRLRENIPGFLAIPLSIQLVLLPYTIHVNNYVSVFSVVINLLVVFLAGIYVPLGISTFLMYIVLPQMGFIDFFGKILSGMGGLITKVDEVFYNRGRMSFLIPSEKTFVMVLMIGLTMFVFSEIFLILVKRRDSKSLFTILCLIVFVSGIFGYSDLTPFDRAKAAFVDVGQGDAFHISPSSNVDILIDGGGRHDYNVGKKTLRPYFLHNGIGDIDLALSTHEHQDHFKGIKELEECFPVKRVHSEGIKGNVIRINPNLEIELLWPLKENIDSEDENYFSRVFMVNMDGIRILVTGDITEEGEKALLREYDGTDKLKCHILKVAHHGSKYSSSVDFLREVSPIVAVISVGNNNYGHPSDEVIEKMNDLGIMIYRTDLDGAVGVIPEGEGFCICTEKTKVYKEYIYD